MRDQAIRVENLSKRYQLGQHEPYRSLRDVLAGAIAAPLRRFGAGSNSADATASENGCIWALKDVSFEVQQGEVIGIIGRNGAGKSTLLKILSRITKPTNGYAEIYGRIGSLLEVGTGFHPELTGRENIYLNGAILGMKRVEISKKFDEIVAFSELEEFLDTPVKRYSSGMYMRLAFAVAAHLEPEILVIDEVLAVGDAAFQKKCLGKMGEVAGTGRTILFVSHNMDAIQRICQRTILLDQGKIILNGLSQEVINTYLNSMQGNNGKNIKVDQNSPFKKINVKIYDQDLNGTFIWKSKEKLKISVEIECERPTSCPRVDLAFYRLDALKLFAVKSDQIIELGNRRIDRHWKIDFLISGALLAPQNLYFDVGIRQSPQVEYLILWQHVCDLLVDAEGDGYRVTKDSLLLPDIEVFTS